jgi:ADP-ribose pyrophosphatase YjhB (NUDIX family)
MEGNTMFEKNSCCSYCGKRFPVAELWPITCQSCGNTNYINPIPVVVMLVPVGDGLVVARRNIEPQKGTLVLPGGYLDLGETWQEGAVRELYEETGIKVSVGEISLYDVQNGLDNTLVISGLAAHQPLSCLKPFSSSETQEIALITKPIDLGFPLHNLLVRRYFSEYEQTRKPNSMEHGSNLNKLVKPDF